MGRGRTEATRAAKEVPWVCCGSSEREEEGTRGCYPRVLLKFATHSSGLLKVNNEAKRGAAGSGGCLGLFQLTGKEQENGGLFPFFWLCRKTTPPPMVLGCHEEEEEEEERKGDVDVGLLKFLATTKQERKET